MTWSQRIANGGRRGRPPGNSGVEEPVRRTRSIRPKQDFFSLLMRNVFFLLLYKDKCLSPLDLNQRPKLIGHTPSALRGPTGLVRGPTQFIGPSAHGQKRDIVRSRVEPHGPTRPNIRHYWTVNLLDQYALSNDYKLHQFFSNLSILISIYTHHSLYIHCLKLTKRILYIT